MNNYDKQVEPTNEEIIAQHQAELDKLEAKLREFQDVIAQVEEEKLEQLKSLNKWV